MLMLKLLLFHIRRLIMIYLMPILERGRWRSGDLFHVVIIALIENVVSEAD